MIACVQRVSRACVRVASESHEAAIAHGLCVLLCVEAGDAEPDAAWMAGKLARLRIFADPAGRMNCSVQDVAGAILLVSQFTLAGECDHGNRPSFTSAAAPAIGRALVARVAALLRDAHGLPVGEGIFGAAMELELVNDGPVTILVRSRRDGRDAD